MDGPGSGEKPKWGLAASPAEQAVVPVLAKTAAHLGEQVIY